MSVVLAIETSTMTGSVALGDGQRVLGEIVIPQEQRQNEALLPAVDRLLVQHHAPRSDIAAIVIGGGPGSFTGLRIAAATAKGFAHALRIPLFAYSGLLAAAFGLDEESAAVCALFDARRDEVYSATYSLGDDLQVLRQPAVETITECLQANDPQAVMFCGDGAVKHRALIERAGGRVTGELSHPRAQSLLHLHMRWPERGRVTDPERWEPDYLRASGAERGIKG